MATNRKQPTSTNTLSNGDRVVVSHENFVKAWQECDSGAEVADRLNLSRQAVHSRAAMLRAKGVKLKRMRAYNRIDVARLNELI